MICIYSTWENFGVLKISEWANPNQLDVKMLVDELRV